MPRSRQRKSACGACDGCSCGARETHYKFERRRSERSPHRASAVATFRDADGRSSLTHVEIEDVSSSGVGMSSPVAVENGAEVTLFGNAAKAPLMTGHVVRCTQTDSGYRIGLSCRTMPLAA